LVDVNFVEYGVNALRVQQSAGDLLSFGAQNGYALGIMIAVIIIIVCFLFVIIYFSKKMRNMTISIFK